VATERAFDAGDIDGRQYGKREVRLTGEREAAHAALEQARRHAGALEQAGSSADAEVELLEHLASLKQAVADDVKQAPDFPALRNVLAELFERVELVRADDDLERLRDCRGEAMVELSEAPVVDADYLLLP
jgi:hypothetical protein